MDSEPPPEGGVRDSEPQGCSVHETSLQMSRPYRDDAGYHHATRGAAIDANTERAASNEVAFFPACVPRPRLGIRAVGCFAPITTHTAVVLRWFPGTPQSDGSTQCRVAAKRSKDQRGPSRYVLGEAGLLLVLVGCDLQRAYVLLSKHSSP